MRIAAFTLAFYLSFLTAQPMVSQVYVCSTKVVEKKMTHSCCAKKESKSEKQSTKKCPCPGVCNPFGHGTCCLGSTPTLSYQFNVENSTREFNSLASANLSSNYLADCFHPPEVV